MDEADIDSKKVPIFMAENGASLTTYTTIDSSVPFELDSLKVKQDLTSISLLWSTLQWPCINMINTIRFQICETEEKSSCFKDGVNEGVTNMTTAWLSSKFNDMTPCTSYLVRSNYHKINH